MLIMFMHQVNHNLTRARSHMGQVSLSCNHQNLAPAHHIVQGAHDMWALWIADVTARKAALTPSPTKAPATF